VTSHWRPPKVGRPQSIVITPDRHHGTAPKVPSSSWWATHATDTTRERFMAAAEARDKEMRIQSWAWRVQSTNFS
jgi:hypothetical protein